MMYVHEQIVNNTSLHKCTGMEKLDEAAEKHPVLPPPPHSAADLKKPGQN